MTAPSKDSALTDVIQTVHRLRAPGGCPWDQKQTHQSLRPYLIEEAYEALDVIDRIGTVDDLKREDIRAAFREELGDVLMQVLLHSEMASETGAFDIHGVAAALNEKLIRRHPHVFGEVKADSAESAVANWEKQKAAEKAKNPEASQLDGVPKGLPALQRATRVIEKVTRVGFQWSDLQGPLAKLEEEMNELKAEVQAWEKASTDDRARLAERIEGELGDLLFSAANIGFLTGRNPEDALRSTLARFEGRFRHVERRLKEQGRSPEQSNLEEMDRYWDEAKRLEREAKPAGERRD